MLHRVFSQGRERACTDSWRGSQSELFTVLPLLLYFAERLVARHTDIPAREIQCFPALVGVIDATQAMKAGRIDAKELRRRIALHHRQCCSYYGADAVIPTFHYSTHHPKQFQQDQLVFNTLVHERKHQLGEGVATRICFNSAI